MALNKLFPLIKSAPIPTTQPTAAPIAPTFAEDFKVYVNTDVDFPTVELTVFAE